LTPALQMLLADDPSAFLSQSATVDRLAKSQQDVLRTWHTSNLRLAQTKAEVATREASAKQLNAAKASAKAEADGNLRQAQAVLNELTAAQRSRIARIQNQQRLQSIREADAARAQVKVQGAPGGRRPSGSPDLYAGNGRAAAAVQFALSQVGESYVAAQAGLRAYDCSGLTLAAWRQSGVSLTHYSKAQYSQTRRVPVSQIRPGDLVFYFGSGAHHVAMYVGNGKMVSASNPEAGVQLIDFLGPWYRERFSGVGRVL